MEDGTGSSTYVYNGTNQVIDLTSPSGPTGFVYDGLGRREAATLPNDITAAYTYDDSGRLLNLTNEGISSFDYTHDNVGNRLSMSAADGAHTYAYDDIYELTIATHPTSPMEAFTYDGVGNRLSSADYSNWSYDDNNRLTGYNGTTYTYDENGNMVTRTDGEGTTSYQYDSENRLIRIMDPQSRMPTYTYDGLGRRVEKNVNGTITRYVYDLEDILLEYDESNNITARYTHGSGIDDIIGMEREGESYFYHTDGLGSITQISDSSNQTVASYTYDAFGNIASQTGSLINSYTYTAREYDPESGLYYYRARYYDPKIGRFLQPDPLDMAMVILIRQYFPGTFIGGLLYQYSLKNPLTISNMYPYVQNSPVNFIDSWGLWSLSLEGYYGLGGGFVFGINPGGRVFLSFRLGYGIGGGISYNPEGTSPGWDPYEKHGVFNAGLGAYGGASVGLGPAYLGLSGNAGVNFEPGFPCYEGIKPYAGIGPEYGLDWGWSLRGGAAVGGEITFY